MNGFRTRVQVFMPLHDAAGFHWLLLAADLREPCYWVYDSMAAPRDVERGTLVTSAVCITFIIHRNCSVYELCLSMFVTNDTCTEGGARTVPYAVVDRCRSLAMGN